MEIDNKVLLENSRNITVLYVEDDEELRESTTHLLSNFFLKIDSATDGLEGYEKYKSFFNETGEYYDLVISDINMPNMNGITMITELKKLNSEQISVFITAFNEIEYLHQSIEIGVDGFLNKPIEIAQLKNILYKVTHAISDKKLVKQYYEQIEDENELHIHKVDASSLSVAQDIFDDLVKNKEQISTRWVSKKIVQKRLQNHAIDVEYFRKHYGLKVIEHFLNVIKGDAEVGNCPVVFVMLEFFKNKNLPLEDIFMICVQFKNSVSSYIFDKYSFNQEVYDDVSLIVDKNFEGVIVNYLKMKNCTKKENKSEEVKNFEEAKESIETNKDNLKESVHHDELINYREYVLENDLYELQDLEEDIDNLSITITGNTVEFQDIVDLGLKVEKYGSILSNYPLFTKLGLHIIKLGINFKKNAQLLFDDKGKITHITALVEGFVNDLIVWRKEIFDNNIENPHFLDDSFFSNVDTIIMFIEYDENEESEINEGEMEFF